MNILLLSVHFAPNVGGVETHLLDLIKALGKRNINVFVLTYRPLVSKNRWKIYEREKKIVIFRLPWIPGLFYKLSGRPILQFLYLVPGLFFSLPFVLLFKGVNTIHAHGLISGFVAVFWGKIFRKRVVISTHSLYEFPKGGLYRRFSIWVFQNADHVSTLSRQALREVRNLGVKKRNSSNFTYWINLKTFRPIKNAKSEVGWRNKFIVLFVGRLVSEKGIPELLEAVTKWNKNITLAIIGSGPYEKQIKKLETEINNLQFFGKKNQDKLPKYYSAADLVIVPSTHEEGFGRVIIESLACSTPVVGSNRGAIPEAMNETVGELIDVNPKNIIEIVETYYVDPRRLQKLSNNTKNFVRKYYSENNVGKIVKTYQ